MRFNAHIQGWTVQDYEGLRQKLTDEVFVFREDVDAKSFAVIVSINRLDEFAALCQAQLTMPFYYVNVQFPDLGRTAMIFKGRVFDISSDTENRRIKHWAITRGLDP